MEKRYEKVDEKNVDVYVMTEQKTRFTLDYLKKVRDSLAEQLAEVEKDIEGAKLVLTKEPDKEEKKQEE